MREEFSLVVCWVDLKEMLEGGFEIPRHGGCTCIAV